MVINRHTFTLTKLSTKHTPVFLVRLSQNVRVGIKEKQSDKTSKQVCKWTILLTPLPYPGITNETSDHEPTLGLTNQQETVSLKGRHYTIKGKEKMRLL